MQRGNVMATIIIGSARHDEFGKYLGGKLGDQLQKKVDDFSGEVSMQTLTDFVKNRSWYIIRFKKAEHAQRAAYFMKVACNNPNDGYDQGNRLAVIRDGVGSAKPTEGDCGTYVRSCFILATGVDPGNFTTFDEVTSLEKTGLVDKAIIYHPGRTQVYEGDIFVTQKKGHTGICIQGNKRGTKSYPPFKHLGIDYSKVFDPDFYAAKNPDVVKALGSDATRLFNHFIVFGCNEKSRVGKTKSTFNVETYGQYPDLVKAFGECKEGNYLPFYKHYCQFGCNENRRTI